MITHPIAQKAKRQQHPLWLEIIRIALAIVIFWKGLAFVSNIHEFTRLMMESTIGVALLLSLLIHLIIVAHVIGALALFTGTYVKIACVMQMPVIIMALFFRNLAENLLNPYAAIWVSIAIFCALLLVVFKDRHDVEQLKDNKDT